MLALSSRQNGSVSSLRAKNHICVGDFERDGLVEPGEYPTTHVCDISCNALSMQQDFWDCDCAFR